MLQLKSSWPEKAVKGGKEKEVESWRHQDSKFGCTIWPQVWHLSSWDLISLCVKWEYQLAIVRATHNVVSLWAGPWPFAIRSIPCLPLPFSAFCLAEGSTPAGWFPSCAPGQWEALAGDGRVQQLCLPWVAAACARWGLYCGFSFFYNSGPWVLLHHLFLLSLQPGVQ